MDLLAKGAAYLTKQRRRYFAQCVEYSRPASGGSTIDVRATIGRTQFQLEGANGVIINAESRDFIVAAADLALDGIVTQPAKGDRITDADGVIFEVMPFGPDQPHWRWCDGNRLDMRIHTKQVDQQS
jgi:hypothetical protein